MLPVLSSQVSDGGTDVRHVVPIAKGGRKTWENIVTACWRCNNKKVVARWRSRHEAQKKPVKPRWNPIVTIIDSKHTGQLA